MTLETKRLRLRPFTEEDAGDLFAYASDPRVGPMAGWPPHKTMEYSREIIRTVFRNPNEFAIVLRETGHVIGSVGLVGRDRGESSDELGYVLSPAYWGRGIVPEAAEAVLRYGFAELGLKEIWCVCREDNRQSRRVIEKCGFTYLFTERCTPEDDKSPKMRFHVLLRENWERRR